ncbi:MAG: hypothetical protein MJA29_11285, partial [Candidatus Omnitrophica bacterium]|nr:hypothetical protein [Candidatus Omnitrophota bacterium]
MDQLHRVVENCQGKFTRLAVLGDFNFPDICWDTVSTPTMGLSHDFCSLTNDFLLSQLIHGATHKHGNTLDLILTDSPEIFCNTEIWPFMFDSDHFPIVTDILLHPVRKHGVPRTVYNYRSADFCGLNDFLYNNLGVDFVTRHSSLGSCIDVIWGDWLETLNAGVDAFIPKSIIRDNHRPRWIDGDVKHLSNQVKTARRKASRDKKASSWAKYKELRNRLRNMTRDKYKSHVNTLGEEMNSNPKRLWSFYHSKTKTNSVPAEVKLGGRCASESEAKAELFNEHFHSVFSHSSPDTLPDITYFENPDLECLVFSEVEVRRVLENLNGTKACGPDNVSPRVLKACASALCRSLSFIFNVSMQTGTVPTDWKLANVVPVFKKKDRESVENYRGISLLSVVSKVMERCIFNQVYPLIEPLLSPAQHGFCKGRSTSTQMVQVLDKIGLTLDNGGQVDMIYLDFSKAFDSVPHDLLTHKVRSFGINGNLLAWLKSYLSDRQQRVVVEGAVSPLLPVVSGVPQGSILGPLLFSMYVNDLPATISELTDSGLYADDAKCYRTIRDLNDCIALQGDLDMLWQWSNVWGLGFSIPKCQVVSITRKANPIHFHYNLHGTVLERVNDVKDLGVTVQSNLTWNRHVDQVVDSANRAWFAVRRVTGYCNNV